MMRNYKSWLFAALFVFFGAFSTQAQMYDWFIHLDLQHVESDYVPAEESDYYRHFLILDNVEPNYLRSPLNLDFLAEGNNTFVLYRYPVSQGGEVEMTPVANVTFTADGDVVNYEITYMNQEPLPGYNLELVTQGTLPVENGDINLDGLVIVDQLKVLVRDVYYDEDSYDNSQIYPWTQCGYVMFLDNGDFNVHTNDVEVPLSPGVALYTLGNYSFFDLAADAEMPTLQAGMMNACFDCFVLGYNLPDVTGYTVLRGSNTYPTDTISYLIRNEAGFKEASHALPEYYGEAASWELLRNDTSLMVLGTYGDYMTYVPVTRTDGKDRVKQDGENTYGGYVMKTGVAKLDGVVSGTVLDQGSEDPMMFKDENGVDCVVFDPIFDLLITLPDYSTFEYEPKWVTIWVKGDNLRKYDFDDEGNLFNVPFAEDENNSCMRIGEQSINYGYWDEELEEFVYDFTNELIIGDDDDEWSGFAATYASAKEGFTFIVRFYYECMVMMPGKDSSEPNYCVVEKQIQWVPIPDYTGVKEMGSGIEVGKTYYNVQGIASDKPYDGFNIVVTHYSDGSTKTTKIIK